ncbi:MAG TPA: rod shape-determining protein RodA, partial [Erythrobacter sp.]|nr:rod shape-determining protein RodA [Erythrobacter sp.]
VLAMLLAVEAIGFVGGGSQRWLNLGFMQLQPSELMKPAVVLVLARYYSTLPVGMVPTLGALVVPDLLILTPVALVLLQPDLGTSLAIVFGGSMVMFAAGLPLRWFIGAAAAG